MPLTFGIAGAVIAPFLAVVGAATAMLTSCKIVVEKKAEKNHTDF